MDISDLDVLLTRETLALIDEVDTDAVMANPASVISTLRNAGHSPAAVALAVEQALLRRKGTLKFGPGANHMLFTRAGLEQATRREVAAVHAARLRMAGVSRVADLGCGIGGDALAFAATGLSVLAVDCDPVTAGIAAFNLRPFSDAVRVEATTAEATDLGEVDAVWLDPARRSPGHRQTHRVRASEYSPALGWIDALRDAHPGVGVKLSPAHDRDTIPAAAEAQWISHNGDTAELVVWSGRLARPGVRRAALVMRGDSVHELTAPGDTEDEPVRELGAYIHEPDGAIIRARLIGNVARSLAAGPVAPQVAYLTGDSDTRSPFVSTFRVREVLPADVKKLRGALAQRRIGTLEIKKRGVDIDPSALRRQLGLAGAESATLIMTRIGGKRMAVLADRLTRSQPREG